jgi:beta-glucosidase
MEATYWNNTRQSGTPVANVTMANAIHLNNGGNTVFAPGVALENFSATYDGILTAPQDEVAKCYRYISVASTMLKDR